MRDCRLTREYTRRNIGTVILENDAVLVEILGGKGADITKIVDKRTNANVLFEAPHEWHAPGNGYGSVPSKRAAFLDHYPGGWQTILPGAGGPAEVASASFGAHGESSVVPWDVRNVVDREAMASITLSTRLPRYPLEIERTVRLKRDSSTVLVEEQVENIGAVSVEYQWLQHLALGPPLLDPAAELDVSAGEGHTDNYQTDTARVPADTPFDWPTVEAAGKEINLDEIPPKSAGVLDGAVLRSIDGQYTISNPDIDLGVTVEYDPDQFPWLWYWGSFGGYEHSPFFGREYLLGLEPCTSPVDGLEDAIEQDATDEIAPGESAATTLSVTVGRA